MQAPDKGAWTDEAGGLSWLADTPIMKRLYTPSQRRLTHFAMMVALVLVLRFVAWDLHHLLDLHAADEPCEICLLVERGGEGGPSVTGVLAQAPPFAVPGPWCTEPPGSTPDPCPLPRGPPSFES